VNATEATWNSIVLHGGEAIDSVGVFVQEQWDYFTGGFLDQGLSTAVGEERVAATGGLATVVDDLRAALRGGVTAGTATLDSLTETSGIDQSQTQSDGVNDFGHRAGHRLIRGLVGRGDAGVAGRHALADLAGSRADVTLAKRTPGDKAEDATGGSDDRAKTSRWSTKLRLGHHRAVFGSDDVKKSDAPGASPDESRAASDESGKSSDKQRKSPLKRSSPWGKRFVGSGAGGDGKG
jgi:hypothetical protein